MVFELIDFSNYEEYIDYKTGRITEQSLELVYQKLGYYTDINEDLKVTIRTIPFDAKEENGKCIYCGKPSTKRVVFAKNY